MEVQVLEAMNTKWMMVKVETLLVSLEILKITLDFGTQLYLASLKVLYTDSDIELEIVLDGVHSQMLDSFLLRQYLQNHLLLSMLQALIQPLGYLSLSQMTMGVLLY